MPAWIISALRALALLATGAAVGEAVGPAPARGIERRGGFDPFGDIPILGGLEFGGRDVKPRRRRRRALTASDKADIAFIVGLIGPAAGKQFAVALGARAR